MSLAGAQHKLAVVLQDGALFEPAGATPSTHILKPDHPDDDYPHMESLAALANACRSPAVARARLFGWLVFNVLVGNSDAHLKNLSFMVSHEGVQLAPFYDLLSVAGYDTPAFDCKVWPEQTQLAWPLHTIIKEMGKRIA